MKQLKTNGKTWNLLDDASELYEARLDLLKEYILRAFENDDKPCVNTFIADFKKFYDKQQYFDAAMLVGNLSASINRKEVKYENMHFAFSMICLREGENQLNLDDNYHKEKLKEMFEDGLLCGVANREVMGFMNRSPFEFRNFVGIMHLMNGYCSIEGQQRAK